MNCWRNNSPCACITGSAGAASAPVLLENNSLTKALLESLPFELTSGQKKAFSEISRDLAAAHPMQRLLQGDVGSGKTVVAALAVLQAIENNCQAALMAPTEILAEQHYQKLSGWLGPLLGPLGMTIAWLSGNQKKKQREIMLANIAEGNAMLAIGTHALFQEQVEFDRLGLVHYRRTAPLWRASTAGVENERR